MKPIRIAPLVKLTQEQMKALLRDSLKITEGRGITRDTADTLLSQEPENVAEYGRLALKREGSNLEEFLGQVRGQNSVGRATGREGTFSLPLAEARARLTQMPGLFTDYGKGGSPVKHISAKPGQEPLYEKVVFKPVFSGSEKDSMASTALAKDAMSKEEGKEFGSVEALVKDAMYADFIWKQLGGAKGASGKFWQRLLERSKYKRFHDTARDYFVSCLMRYKSDSSKFSKNFPTEARLIKAITDEFPE